MSKSTFGGLFRGRKTVAPTKTAGVSGTAIFGGYLVENESDPKLAGFERYRTFSNILANTTIVAASVRLFLNLTAKVGWIWEPADDSPEAKRIAEEVEAILNEMDTPWSRVVRRSAMYRFYGFSIQEWTASRRDDGLFGFADIEPRPQLTIERWDRDDRTGKIVGVSQRSPQDADELYLPRNKLVYAVDDSLNDSPQGLGLLRHVVDSVKQLERYEQLEGFGYESDLRGIPIGRAPLAEIQSQVQNGTLTAADANSRIATIKSFIQKHIKNPNLGLLLDSKTYTDQGENQTPSSVNQFDIELLQGGSPSLGDVAKAIERVNREIARVMGTEHLMLGDGGQGSEALSRDKSHNFALMVDSTTQELSEIFYRDIVKPLGRLNGWDMSLLPKPKPESARYRDVQEITGALADMASAGAVIQPNDPVINNVRDILNVSISEMDEALDGSLTGSTNEMTDEEEALSNA